MKLKNLRRLADIVVDLDERKNIADSNIVNMTDRAIKLIANMKLSGMDVGALQETFTSMQLMCGNKVVFAELIDMAHEEITRLLGCDAWRVYGCDEGAWFYQADETYQKVAA